MTISLTGKKTIFHNNLEGKEFQLSNNNKDTPYAVIKIKKKIINLFIIPIHLKKWDIVKQNMFEIERIMLKIKNYKLIYLNEDLDIYEYLLNFIVSVFSEHNELQEIEKKMYSVDGSNNIATLVHKTPSIRLKAEYEIYHLIYGKPNRKNNETYQTDKLDYIIKLLKNENITFDQIKNKVTSL